MRSTIFYVHIGNIPLWLLTGMLEAERQGPPPPRKIFGPPIFNSNVDTQLSYGQERSKIGTEFSTTNYNISEQIKILEKSRLHQTANVGFNFSWFAALYTASILPNSQFWQNLVLYWLKDKALYYGLEPGISIPTKRKR